MKELLHRVLSFVFRLLPTSVIGAMFRNLHIEIDKRGNEWVTAHRRPKCLVAIPGSWMAAPSHEKVSDVALVIQGPLIIDDDFTHSSVSFYRRLYPACQIIVSTWNDSDPAAIAKLRDIGVEVVLSQYPTNSGILNVNYQMISTRAGINRAIESGAKYVLKLRSDQRIHAAGLDVAFPALLAAFPPGRKGVGARILVATNDTRLFVPFHLSDQIQFGLVDDMLNFWSAPLDVRPRSIDAARPVRDLVNTRAIPEVYLTSHFLERMGIIPNCDLQLWWEMLRDYFCVVDNALLDWHWPKYDRLREYRNRSYTRPKVGEMVTFVSWLQITQSAFPRIIDPETVLDLKIMTALDDTSLVDRVFSPKDSLASGKSNESI